MVSTPAYYKVVADLIASSVGLTNFYAVCDRASGGRMPILFEEAVMCFVLPRVRLPRLGAWECGYLDFRR